MIVLADQRFITSKRATNLASPNPLSYPMLARGPGQDKDPTSFYVLFVNRNAHDQGFKELLGGDHA